uniref:Uncharacterized protein n=1 Tax=Megaselia scalaris TaxID=36166 RepID=T1GMQ4_MEGSC
MILIKDSMNAFEMYKQKKQRKQAEISEREQLLNHRFTANATSPETCVDIDYSLQHHTSLQNAHKEWMK